MALHNQELITWFLLPLNSTYFQEAESLLDEMELHHKYTKDPDWNDQRKKTKKNLDE